MMEQIAGMAYRDLEFDKRGRLKSVDALCPPGTTDLLIMSHGWKNDRDDAHRLYTGFVEGLLAAGGEEITAGRKFAAVGILWPAFRFNSDLSILPDDFLLAEGGAASASDSDLDADSLQDYAEEMAAALDLDGDAAAQFIDLAMSAGNVPDDADALVDLLRQSLTIDVADPDSTAEHEELFSQPGHWLVGELSAPPIMPIPPPPDPDGLQGAAAGIGDLAGAVRSKIRGWFSGGRAGVARTLNMFTYYEMKARAGTVGEALARQMERSGLEGVRIHLIGHSFGGRLVTAATNNLQSLRINSLTLLQAAFSHNGFSSDVDGSGKQGAFRSVVADRKVDGPIVISCTHNDVAVGFFYAVASRASRENAAAIGLSTFIGGPKDQYGGMGANGAQQAIADEAIEMAAWPGLLPEVRAGVLNNVIADEIISDHNDVGADSSGQLIRAAVHGPARADP